MPLIAVRRLVAEDLEQILTELGENDMTTTVLWGRKKRKEKKRNKLVLGGPYDLVSAIPLGIQKQK